MKNLLENIAISDLKRFQQTLMDFVSSMNNPENSVREVLHELTTTIDEISSGNTLGTYENCHSVCEIVESLQKYKLDLVQKIDEKELSRDKRVLLTRHVLEFFDHLTLDLLKRDEIRNLSTNGKRNPPLSNRESLLEENARLKEIYALSLEIASHNTPEKMYEFIRAHLKSVVPFNMMIILDTSLSSICEHIYPVSHVFVQDIEFGRNKIEELCELFNKSMINQDLIIAKIYDRELYVDSNQTQDNPESIFVPMINDDKTRGILGLFREHGNPFKPYELHSLSIVASLLDLVVRNINSIDYQKQLRKSLHEQIDFARSVQKRVLPGELKTDKLTIKTHFQPSESISGDFFKFFKSDHNSHGVVIGDVTGHGLAAGMMMMTVMGILTEAFTMEGAEINEMFRRANQYINDIVSSEFFLTLLAVWYSEDGSLRYFNAGHPPGLLYKMKSKELVELPPTCFPMGIFDDLDLDIREMDIDEDFRILLYTDGLIEAKDGNGKQFGVKKLKEILPQIMNTDCDHALEILLTAVNSHTESAQLKDDVAVVLIEKLL